MKFDSDPSIAFDVTEFIQDTRLAIYVHWSPSNEISNHDTYFINVLAQEFDQVLVVCNLNERVTNKPKIDKGKNSNINCLYRLNEGYDFGGYKAGMQHVVDHSSIFSEVLLVNNSTFLFQDTLSNLMNQVRESTFQITSITSSMEKSFHLQSYFLHFKSEAIHDAKLWDWFGELATTSDKRKTVNSLEIPFLTEMNRLGYTCGAIWEITNLEKYMFSSFGSNLLQEFRREPSWILFVRTALQGKSLNPTHYMWPLLLELGCPLVKKDLLRESTVSALGTDKWKAYCKSPELTSLISGDLANS